MVFAGVGKLAFKKYTTELSGKILVKFYGFHHLEFLYITVMESQSIKQSWECLDIPHIQPGIFHWPL